MKERPVIFTAESVRAILAGHKTQTRRVLKPQPSPTGGSRIDRIEYSGPLGWVPTSPSGKVGIFHPVTYRCPYGNVGDRLWVRESWTDEAPNKIYYRADMDFIPSTAWRSPIFMPRNASRLLLEIVHIRTEPLHNIGTLDAIAEGITGPFDVGYKAYYMPGDSKPRYSCPRAAFEALWNYINFKRHPWDSNPWVWAITFKVCSKG